MPFLVDALGYTLAVDSDDPTIEATARELLSDFVIPSPRGEVHERRLSLVDGESWTRSLVGLVGNLNFAVLTARAGALLPHAGAVARADGSVALLCGESGAGKSTLTAALVRAGCAYVTDETAILDPQTLLVTPFRKPISLKPGSHRLFAEHRPGWATGPDDTWLVRADDLRPVPLPSSPLTPRVVFFPRYSAGSSGVDITAMTSGETAFLLGRQCSHLRETADGALPALARVARRTVGYRVDHGDTAAAAAAVMRVWDDHAA